MGSGLTIYNMMSDINTLNPEIQVDLNGLYEAPANLDHRRKLDSIDQENKFEHHQLDVQEKWQIIALIWKLYDPSRDVHDIHAYSNVGQFLGVHPSVVASVWKQYCEQFGDGRIKFPDLTPKHHGHAHKKLTVKGEFRVRAILDSKKGWVDYRELAFISKIPQTSLFRYLHDLGIQKIIFSREA